MGAWIEIGAMGQAARESDVAPHMGAWIEIRNQLISQEMSTVAPHMGAWIEIGFNSLVDNGGVSHPIWVRGLKFCNVL